MYYIYKKPDGLPCVTEYEQSGMELIKTAETADDAEKKLMELLYLRYFEEKQS